MEQRELQVKPVSGPTCAGMSGVEGNSRREGLIILERKEYGLKSG